MLCVTVNFEVFYNKVNGCTCHVHKPGKGFTAHTYIICIIILKCMLILKALVPTSVVRTKSFGMKWSCEQNNIMRSRVKWETRRGQYGGEEIENRNRC